MDTNDGLLLLLLALLAVSIIALFLKRPPRACAGHTPMDAELRAVIAENDRELTLLMGNYAPILAWKIAAHYNGPINLNDTPMWGVPPAPKDTPVSWVQTAPDFLPPLLPDWGKNRLIAGEFEMGPDKIPPLTSAEYNIQVEEVRAVGSKTSKTRTPEQTMSAHVWDAGVGTITLPGIWNKIATRAATDAHMDASSLREMLRVLNVALADAGIAAWRYKYALDMWRPETAIHEAATDGNPDTIPDPNWQPLLVSPPFPSCVSGHSTFSGAAAVVLEHFLPGHSPVFIAHAGYTGCYKSFELAAEAAGMSRVWGGIQFNLGNREGIRLGESVGRNTLDKMAN